MLKFNTKEYFNDVWDEKSKTIVLNLMNDFVRICEIQNLDYFLIYGSLLGCSRNNKIIPWDGDIDFSILEGKDYSILKNMLENCGHKIHLYDDKNSYYQCMKICHVSGQKTHEAWSWPWIDVYFHRIENNEIKLVNVNKNIFYKNHSEKFYPLKKMMFENLAVNVPNQNASILNDLYPNWDAIYESCKFSHKNQKKNNIICKIPYNKM